jgi:hypothetical protein
LPDIVLGALIGIGGGIVGAIIGALSSYIVTRKQINAHRDELNQQLDYQDKKTQKEWFIQDRKSYLSPLRKPLSEWVICSHQQTNMNVRLRNDFEKYEKGSKERLAEINEFHDAHERVKNLSSQVAILRGQISDGKLDKLISDLMSTQIEVDNQRMPLIRIFNKSDSANTANIEKAIATIEKAIEKDEQLLEKVRNRLLKVNKRIEELLSGAPSD